MTKFIIKTLFYFIPFICIYSGYTKLIRHFTGDIGTLIQFPFGKKYEQMIYGNCLPENLTIDTLVVSYEKLQIADALQIITIGDSFSSQEFYGYQNYLSHLMGNRIQNIIMDRVNFERYNQFNTAISLLNSEIIDASNYRIVILQVVGRNAIEKLCDIDFEMFYEVPKDINDYYHLTAQNKNIGLYEFCAFIRLRLGYKNPIFKRNLTQKCFTHRYFSKILYHYQGDMGFQNLSKTDMDKAKENLIRVNKKFSEKGIKLILLIAADKYDVYRPFMTDDSLPVDTTTDELSKIPGICVIDTKPMLQKMVRDGEQDVYMLNDSHWSYKASEAVAHELFRYIKVDQDGTFVEPPM